MPIYTAEQRARLTPAERFEYAEHVTHFVLHQTYKDVNRLRQLQDKAGIPYSPAKLPLPGGGKRWMRRLNDNEPIPKEAFHRYENGPLMTIKEPSVTVGNIPGEFSEERSFWVFTKKPQ